MPRRSQRLQRYIDLGHIDEEWTRIDREAAERDAALLQEWDGEAEEDEGTETALTWPERIENYRRTIGTPYLGHENGWTYGTWFMGNRYEKKTDYYGAYQGNFLKRIAALFPDRQRVLHLFAGKVDLAAFPGDTLDIRPELEPTWCYNAETCEGVPLNQYDFVLADPPYSASDAERYGTSMVSRNKVVATLAAALRPGAYVAWLDQVYPMFSKIALQPEAVIGVVGSTNHRFRVLTVFRRV